MDKSHLSFAVVSFLIIMLLSTTSSACIGMVATKLHLNISAGYSGVAQVNVFNNCDTPFDFDAGAALYPIKNQTTPNVTTSPKHGTILGHEQIGLNVTINMPLNVTPGTNWTGGVAVMELSNSSIVGGANIQGGVRTTLKVTTLSAPISFFEYEIIAISITIIVALLMVIVYLILSKKKLAKTQKKIATTKRSKPTRHRRR